MCLDEGLLRDLEGVILVAQHSHRYSEYAALILTHQRLEGPVVTFTGSGNECSFVSFHRLSARLAGGKTSLSRKSKVRIARKAYRDNLKRCAQTSLTLPVYNTFHRLGK